MDKKEALKKLEGLNIEEKIALLSETEEAYVRGFIEGAILVNKEQEQTPALRDHKKQAGQKPAKQ